MEKIYPTADQVRAINSRSRSLDESHRSIVKSAAKSITDALLQGKDLNKARKLVGSADWEKWLRDNAPKLNRQNVDRYMKLAKTASRLKTDDASILGTFARVFGDTEELKKLRKILKSR